MVSRRSSWTLSGRAFTRCYFSGIFPLNFGVLQPITSLTSTIMSCTIPLAVRFCMLFITALARTSRGFEDLD
eukprot:118969-Rhodomonas_salina.1